jgi:hypothetical protein
MSSVEFRNGLAKQIVMPSLGISVSHDLLQSLKQVVIVSIEIMINQLKELILVKDSFDIAIEALHNFIIALGIFEVVLEFVEEGELCFRKRLELIELLEGLNLRIAVLGDSFFFVEFVNLL